MISRLWYHLEKTGTHSDELTSLKRWTKIIVDNEFSSESLREVLQQISSRDPSILMISTQSAWTILMSAANEGSEELDACIDVVKCFNSTLEHCAFSGDQNTRIACCGCLGYLPPKYLSEMFTNWIFHENLDNESRLSFVSSGLQVAESEGHARSDLDQLLVAVEQAGNEEQRAEARSFRVRISRYL